MQQFNASSPIENYQAILLDISGVLYDGDEAIAGSVAAFRKLQACDVPVRLVTNTSTQAPEQIAEKLAKLGFEIDVSQLFTATVAAQRYISEHALKPYVLVHSAVTHMFQAYPADEANCVLLGDAGEDFTYQYLNEAFHVLNNGGALVVMGDNRFYCGKAGLQLDIGPFMKALEYAASCQATVTGKPSPDFFKLALASVPCEPNQALMVGDDVWSDCRGAIQAGLQAALVKTGKFEAAQLHELPTSCLVTDDLYHLVEYLGL